MFRKRVQLHLHAASRRIKCFILAAFRCVCRVAIRTRLGRDFNTFHGIKRLHGINILLTSPSLWREIQGEKVLYFQIDSAICSNSLYQLSDFLHYDFIGAPWADGGCCNGGFSLRSRSKTLQLLEGNRYRFPLHQINEDGWFSMHMRRIGANVAPNDVAKTFSVETIFHSRPFAVHKPHLSYLGKANMLRLCSECPEMRTISKDCRLSD